VALMRDCRVWFLEVEVYIASVMDGQSGSRSRSRRCKARMNMAMRERVCHCCRGYGGLGDGLMDAELLEHVPEVSMSQVLLGIELRLISDQGVELPRGMFKAC
jgi:hypothetical protein